MSRLVQNGTVTASRSQRLIRGGRVAIHQASGRPAAMHSKVASPACTIERARIQA